MFRALYCVTQQGRTDPRSLNRSIRIVFHLPTERLRLLRPVMLASTYCSDHVRTLSCPASEHTSRRLQAALLRSARRWLLRVARHLSLTPTAPPTLSGERLCPSRRRQRGHVPVAPAFLVTGRSACPSLRRLHSSSVNVCSAHDVFVQIR